MTGDLYLRFLLALLAIVALLAGFAWLARRYGPVARGMRAGGRRRLAILEVAPIDARRRLVLLRRDDTEHLVLLGAETALLIERGIVPRPAAASFAVQLEEAPR